MSKKMDLVLEEALGRVNPSEDKIKEISESLESFLVKINSRIKNLKIDAEIFVGGSYAKNTLVRKDKYDVDLFLRFSKKYSEKDFSRLSKKILRFFRGVKTVHGSRDYFRIRRDASFFFEIVPVKKIVKPGEAQNVTDLSYSHVKYISKKIKKKEIFDSIKLAKAFCATNRVYGAESYVGGFSGYALELLVYYFGSFEKFLRELSKNQNKKLIIDIEKYYKKNEIMIEINSSKLDSPIVLIDPTYKVRNVLAALTDETFDRFQKSAEAFLKNPSMDFFVLKKIDFEKERREAKKNGREFLELKLKTKKQAGDIAGTKLLKFFNHLSKETEKYFDVEKKDFEYDGKKEARSFLVLKRKNKIVFDGPKVEDSKNVEKFKLEHGKVYEKNGRLYSEKKVDVDASEFLENWKRKNWKKVREMGICGINF